MFDPLGEVLQRPVIQRETSPEFQAREMERKVHNLLEDSAVASGQSHYEVALDRAKEAGKRERGLCKHKEVGDNFEAAVQIHVADTWTARQCKHGAVLRNLPKSGTQVCSLKQPHFIVWKQLPRVEAVRRGGTHLLAVG